MLPIHFAFDSSALTEQSKQYLVNLAYQFRLEGYRNVRIVFEGHTDIRGAMSYNQALSERRAKAVQRFFSQQMQGMSVRIGSQGFGETRPLMQGNSEAAHAKNRRVEIRLY